jgi:chorismate mutase
MRLILCILSLVALGCLTMKASPSEASPSSQGAVSLVDLMCRRLELNREIAWAKFQENLPVRDEKREKSLLTMVTIEARRLKAPESEVTEFFKAQFVASYALQEELIDGWKNGGPRPNHLPLNLALDLRPKVDQVSDDMVKAIDDYGPNLHDSTLEHYAKETLLRKGFSAGVVALAIKPFE